MIDSRFTIDTPVAILRLITCQALPLPPPGFDALSVDEKIDYVQSLWDHISARPEDVPIPEWHREVLAERLAAPRANKTQGKDWEEIEKDVSAELSERTT